jgi:hypothetical protein
MTAFSPVSSQILTRVAVLIDGDHIPASFRTTISTEAAKLGEVISTQLFCDLSLRPDWASETGIDVTHCKGRPGKNSADMSLCIAALDLAYRGLATAFLIASNDRDFEPLTRHLRRLGCTANQVKTLAPPPTPKPVAPPTQSAPPHSAAPVTEDPATRTLLAKVRAAIKGHGGPDGIKIEALNPLLHRQGVRISQEPEKNWRAWLRARPEHFHCDPKGPLARVRLKK